MTAPDGSEERAEVALMADAQLEVLLKPAQLGIYEEEGEGGRETEGREEDHREYAPRR
jgi:hypothetical protein